MDKQKNPRNEANSKKEEWRNRLNFIIALFAIMCVKILLTSKIKLEVDVDATSYMVIDSTVIKEEKIIMVEELSSTDDSVETEILIVDIEAEEDENIETISLISYKSIEEIIAEISPQMDISKPSGISKSNFIFLLEHCKYDKNNVLKENAALIWEECQTKQLHEFAVVGILAAESWWANPEKSELAANKKNIMSIKNDDGDYKTYETYSDCILDAMRILSEEYVSEDGRYHTGGQLDIIGNTYAENGAKWAALVAECAEMSTRALLEEN